jgi:hypothetical protein
MLRFSAGSEAPVILTLAPSGSWDAAHVTVLAALLSLFADVAFFGFFDFSDGGVFSGLNGSPCGRGGFQCHA